MKDHQDLSNNIACIVFVCISNFQYTTIYEKQYLDCLAHDYEKLVNQNNDENKTRYMYCMDCIQCITTSYFIE